MSWKVKEGHGRSFPITGLTFYVKKVMGGGWPVWLQYQPQSIPVPFLWTLDLNLGLDNYFLLSLK